MAAAAWLGGPPFSCHSNFFFENVVKPLVLATFFANVEAERPRRSLKQPLVNVRTPTAAKASLFGEFYRKYTLQT